MIIASVNGTHGQGFVEVVEHADGSVHRTGLLKLSAANAKRLQALFDAHEPLIYSGPVFTDGHWQVETFPIIPTKVVVEAGAPPILSITLDGVMLPSNALAELRAS
jgi:hypothetical protein